MRIFHKLIVLLFLIMLSNVSLAETNHSSKIEILSDIAKSLGEIGDSMIKITNGIKHVIVTGEEGVSYVLAKKTKHDLKELSAQSTQFASIKNTGIVISINDYLKSPDSDSWQYVQANIRRILIRGAELLTEWNNERSDFIVEPSYSKLVESLNSRLSILEKFSNMEAPLTEEELQALKKLNEEYKKLLEIFKEAIQELNTYIKKESA